MNLTSTPTIPQSAIELPLPIVSPAGEYRPLWELSPDEFALFAVTPLSKGGDTSWAVPIVTPGVTQAKCKLNWYVELFDGSRLTDPQHAERLVWAALPVCGLQLLPARFPACRLLGNTLLG